MKLQSKCLRVHVLLAYSGSYKMSDSHRNPHHLIQRTFQRAIKEALILRLVTHRAHNAAFNHPDHSRPTPHRARIFTQHNS